MEPSRRFRVTFDPDSFQGKSPTIDYRAGDLKILIAMLEATSDSLQSIRGIQDVTEHPEHCRAFGPEHNFVPSAWTEVLHAEDAHNLAHNDKQATEMHCSRCLYRVKLPPRKDL